MAKIKPPSPLAFLRKLLLRKAGGVDLLKYVQRLAESDAGQLWRREEAYAPPLIPDQNLLLSAA
jgi:hypothetical protein